MYLTVDIGLRNLSMCCMSCIDKNDLSSYQLHFWDVINTLQHEEHKCSAVMKGGNICNKKCSLQYENNGVQHYSCRTHFPKDIKKLKKNEYKDKLVKDFILQDIALIVLQKVEELCVLEYETFKRVHHVVIELQPKINNKMKFVSHLIFGKFVEFYKGTNTTVRFVRASQKLKGYTGPDFKCTLKGAYAKRKWLSIQYTKWYLENKLSKEQLNYWMPIFMSKPTQADMGDTFLMALNALKK